MPIKQRGHHEVLMKGLANVLDAFHGDARATQFGMRA